MELSELIGLIVLLSTEDGMIDQSVVKGSILAAWIVEDAVKVLVVSHENGAIGEYYATQLTVCEGSDNEVPL